MANDNVGHQPLPRHGVERFGDAMADSRVMIGSTHVPGHVWICARTQFRSMSNDANGWDLLVYGFGDEAYLIASLRAGRPRQRTGRSPADEQTLHASRLVRHCQAHGITHHLDAVP